MGALPYWRSCQLVKGYGRVSRILWMAHDGLWTTPAWVSQITKSARRMIIYPERLPRWPGRREILDGRHRYAAARGARVHRLKKLASAELCEPLEYRAQPGEIGLRAEDLSQPRLVKRLPVRCRRLRSVSRNGVPVSHVSIAAACTSA